MSTSQKRDAYDHIRLSVFGRERQRLINGLKKNYAVWPLLFVVFGLAPSMIIFMAIHKGTNPDTIWTNKNPEPWNNWKNRREKLLQFADFDIKNYKIDKPEFDYKPEPKRKQF